MMRALFFSIVTMCAGAISFQTGDAAAPKAVINGPTTGTPGELLTLDASQSEGAVLFKWACTPDLTGRKVFEPLCGDHSKIRICTIPGTYVYTLAVANEDGIDMLSWTVHIPGNPPPNPPTPNPPGPTPPAPNPQPEPNPPLPPPTPPTPPEPSPPQPEPIPDGKFKLARDIVAWANDVRTANLREESEALAEACSAVRGQIAAMGGLNSAQEILAALLAANRAALGSNLANWEGFGKKLSARIAAIYTSGGLKTRDDWMTLLGEAELGFRNAGK